MLIAVYVLLALIVVADAVFDYIADGFFPGMASVRIFLHSLMFGLLILTTAAIIRQRKQLGMIDARRTINNQLFDNMIRHSRTGLSSLTPDMTIEFISDNIIHDVGLTHREVIGRKCYDVLANGEMCSDCPVERTLRTGQIYSTKRRYPVPGNEENYISQTAVPIFSSANVIDRVVEIVVPITKEVLLERENNDLFLQTAEALSKLIAERDPYTKEHSVGVRNWAVRIGLQMGLAEEEIRALATAATLHDIGKIGIPEAILNKPGRLTDAEYEIIKRHSSIGFEALKDISRFKEVAEYVLYHHEKYDGTGYPTGIRGGDIPVPSRILAVADVYEAITSDRVYRRAMSDLQARETIVNGRGSQFDPLVVDAFFAVLDNPEAFLKMA